MILFSIVKRLLPTIHFDNRWTIALNGPIWINDSFLWSSNDLFQPPYFANCWTIVCNDPVTRFVQRSFSTIPLYDREPNIYRVPILRSLNGRFQGPRFGIIEGWFSIIRFDDRCTIVLNDSFWLLVNNRAHLFHFFIVERPFQPPRFGDRSTIVCNDSFTRSVNDRS